uniref:Uncharacterized protein n=1 Tax=Craspedostauros australis TaxID=1486917 RepID=A0A7R9WSJ1_9STRA
MMNPASLIKHINDGGQQLSDGDLMGAHATYHSTLATIGDLLDELANSPQRRTRAYSPTPSADQNACPSGQDVMDALHCTYLPNHDLRPRRLCVNIFTIHPSYSASLTAWSPWEEMVFLKTLFQIIMFNIALLHHVQAAQILHDYAAQQCTSKQTTKGAQEESWDAPGTDLYEAEQDVDPNPVCIQLLQQSIDLYRGALALSVATPSRGDCQPEWQTLSGPGPSHPNATPLITSSLNNLMDINLMLGRRNEAHCCLEKLFIAVLHFEKLNTGVPSASSSIQAEHVVCDRCDNVHELFWCNISELLWEHKPCTAPCA